MLLFPLNRIGSVSVCGLATPTLHAGFDTFVAMKNCRIYIYIYIYMWQYVMWQPQTAEALPRRDHWATAGG